MHYIALLSLTARRRLGHKLVLVPDPIHNYLLPPSRLPVPHNNTIDMGCFTMYLERDSQLFSKSQGDNQAYRLHQLLTGYIAQLYSQIYEAIQLRALQPEIYGYIANEIYRCKAPTAAKKRPKRVQNRRIVLPPYTP